jgi:hypothetical protein
MGEVIKFRPKTTPQIPLEAHRMVIRAGQLIDEAHRLMALADAMADRAGVPKHGRSTPQRPPVARPN